MGVISLIWSTISCTITITRISWGHEVRKIISHPLEHVLQKKEKSIIIMAHSKNIVLQFEQMIVYTFPIKFICEIHHSTLVLSAKIFQNSIN